MATNKSGKRAPSSANVSRSYSDLYKSAAAGANVKAPAAPVAPLAPAKVKVADKAPVVLKTSDEVDWRGEYGYVLKDLRTLGLVTGVLVVAIVVVGLFV